MGGRGTIITRRIPIIPAATMTSVLLLSVSSDKVLLILAATVAFLYS
jgi:hypothetical protein